MNAPSTSVSAGAARLRVLSDSRWPEKTGIGNVLVAMKERAPAHISVVDLAVDGRIGSPLSPFVLGKALSREAANGSVFWSAGFVPPAGARIPTVVTVHDLTHLHFYSRLHAAYYGMVFKPLYRRCSEIVCVSDYTRREFLAWSGMPESRVSVVYNGVTPAFARNTEVHDPGFRYILYPGNHRSYKNLERLIAAFAASSLPRAGVRLAMTGNDNPVLLAAARKAGIGSSVHFFGRVPDEALPALYRGALAVAFVSLYEGFGLPIIEAMASDVPVLTSNVSAMPEVGGNAAMLVDPRSVEEITRGLDALSSSEALRTELVGRGREQVRRFDWDRSASELWQIVDRAAHQ